MNNNIKEMDSLWFVKYHKNYMFNSVLMVLDSKQES